MTFEQIVAALPTLTDDQVRDLRVHLTILRGMPTGNAQVESDADLIVEAIVHTIRHAGLFCSVQQLRKDRSRYRTFTEKVPWLLQYVRNATTIRNEQRALLRMGFGYVAHDLQWMKVPLSGSVLMSNVSMLPASIDKRFPGYARNGWLSYVIRRHIEGGSNVRHKRGSPPDVRPGRSAARA